jgi:sugar lactone lactonase YvrE
MLQTLEAFNAVDANDEAIRLEYARQYVTSMCADLQGNIWVGTEGRGVQRFTPGAERLSQWQQFTTKNGIGDDCVYAVACDLVGRVWVGHLNHGVSVYDGKKWQNYDVVGGVNRPDSGSGPLGERVFRIAVCPVDGDVWIATNCGLTRYDQTQASWTYYTRSDGLPSDEATSLAFDQHGNLYVGTQCDGIVMANASDGYKYWRPVTGPDEEPNAPKDDGLPTNLINDLLVTKNGMVVAATNVGLAWSTDDGQNWQYVRGADWTKKVTQGSKGQSPGFSENYVALLSEDYCTCLSEAADGQIYVGHRQTGVDLVDLTQSKVTSAINSIYAKALVKSGVTFVGSYPGGVLQLTALPNSSTTPAPQSAVTTMPPLPLDAKAPSLDELNRILDAMAGVRPLADADQPHVFAMNDDWRTQGDWLGRYGRYWADLLGMDGSDYVWGAGSVPAECVVCIGNHHKPDDVVRYWVGHLYTDDRRALELPPVYLDSRIVRGFTSPDKDRRQAYRDDHGEDYPQAFDGPDLYCNLNVPNGLFMLSLYEMSADGYFQADRFRDFKILVNRRTTEDLQGFSDADQQLTLASGRVIDFRNGVYKRYVVRGPAQLSIHVCRQHSLNTNLSAIMLDLPDERPAPYFKSTDQAAQIRIQQIKNNAAMLSEWQRDPQTRSKHFNSCSSEQEAVKALIERLDEMQDWNPLWWAMNRQRIATLMTRWCCANGLDRSSDLKTRQIGLTCFYESGLFETWDAGMEFLGEKTARQIEKSLRWNDSIPAYSGHGFETVTAYLNANPPKVRASGR